MHVMILMMRLILMGFCVLLAMRMHANTIRLTATMTALAGFLNSTALLQPVPDGRSLQWPIPNCAVPAAGRSQNFN